MKNIGAAFAIGLVYQGGVITLIILRGENPYLSIATMFTTCFLLVGIVISIENSRERKGRGRSRHTRH
jgi:hypothetical protein